MNTKTPHKKTPLARVIEAAKNELTELPWFEAFFTGTHTDKHGQTLTFSQEDLQQMVDNFEANKVPFVTGHPQEDAPAYGYARNILLTDDGELYLYGENVDLNFAKSVIKGQYGKRSLGLKKSPEKGWYIDHVAFLGAVDSALDLKPVGDYRFSAAPDAQVEYAVETRTGKTLVSFLRRFKTWLATNGDPDEASRIIDDWEIDLLQEDVIREGLKDEQDAAPLYSKPTENNEEIPVKKFSQEEMDAAIAKAKAEGEQAGKTSAEAEFSQSSNDRLEALEEQNKQLLFSQRLETNKRWVTDQLKAQRLTPAQAEGLAEFMTHQEGLDTESATFEFSSSKGDETKSVKKTSVEFMKQMVESSQPHGLLDDIEQVEAGVAGGDARAIHTKALQYQKQEAAKGHTVEIEDAIVHVTGGSNE